MRTRNVLKGQVEVQAVPEKVLRTRGSKNKPVELSTVKKIQSSTVPAKIRLGRSTKTADKENHSNASPTEAVTAVTKTRVGRRNKLEDITEPEEHLPKKRQNDSNPKTSYSKITAVTRKETSSPVREQIKAATEKTSADDSLAPAKRRGRPRKTAPDSVVQTTNVPQLTLEGITNRLLEGENYICLFLCSNQQSTEICPTLTQLDIESHRQGFAVGFQYEIYQ